MKRERIAWRLLCVLSLLAMWISSAWVAVPMTRAADTGWASPSQDEADTGGDGNGFEGSPTGAYADGDPFASNDNGAGDNHRYYNFGLEAAIPNDAAIVGFEVRLDGWVDIQFSNSQYDVELSWDGGTSWSSVRSTTSLSASQSTFLVGGPNDEWGHTWSAGELANQNFRVRITSVTSGGLVRFRDFFLDWVAVRVYYATAHIQGTIWEDANANSVQDGSETGLAALHVTVYQDDGDGTFEGGGGDPEAGAGDTDGNGFYNTGPFAEGFSYWIDVSDPTDYSLTTPPEPRLVNLPDGNSVTQNFGYAPQPSGNAGIAIAKEPDTQTIANGATATFTIAITNTGDLPLTLVAVSDALAPDCERAFALLAPGQSETYTCTRGNVTADFTNSATATGAPLIGSTVSDTDTAFVDVINSGIAIAKTPDAQTIVSGSTVTFTINVTNTGDVPLTNVTVSDALAPNCARTFATLTAGQKQTYTCTRGNVTADFTNSATATGTPPVGNVVSATDTALVDVIHPAIDIAKTPDTQTIVSGSTVTFTLAVTNTGDVSLTNVTVSDALAPNCARTFATLTAGQKQTYTCTRANVTADFTNSATATGTPPVGSAVSDTDTALVDVIHPAIDIAKTPDTQVIVSGSTVTFTITVTNTGDVPLTNVTISDALAPNCSRALATLAVGAKGSYTCTLANVRADFTNTATTACTSPIGSVTTDADTAQVIIDDTLACPAGMVAYWKLDESSGPPYDDYYRNHNGTCAGQCPTSVAGHINAGQAFNSSTTGINVPADKAFNWGLTDSFSIELWMRTNSASTCAGNQVIVGRDENANALHWWVGCKVGGQAAFYLRDKNGTLAGVTATKDVSDGVWHHIVAARDGNANKLLIFVDGVEQGSTSAIYTSGFDSTTAELNIGWLDALQGYHFEGIADEVAVYDRALAPAEIQRHYFDGLVGRWYCEIIAPAPNAHSIFLPIIRKGS